MGAHVTIAECTAACRLCGSQVFCFLPLTPWQRSKSRSRKISPTPQHSSKSRPLGNTTIASGRPLKSLAGVRFSFRTWLRAPAPSAVSKSWNSLLARVSHLHAFSPPLLARGIGQARDSLPGYGQGMGGYGKRFGSSLVTGASTEFFGTFLFSSILRRDPRYFVSLRGGPWHRIGYGVSRFVVARSDAGTEGVNWPGILGPLFAESLANSYLPVKEQTAGRTFRRYGVRLGFTAGANIFKEYWPTIFRSLRITKIAPGLSPGPVPPASRPPTTPRPRL